MPSRLPVVAGDSGVWGSTLNDFLSQSLATNGTLRVIITTNTGPHVIGGATAANIQLLQTGSFPSATNPLGFSVQSSLTADSLSTTEAALLRLTSNTITTAAAAFTLPDAAGALFSPPTLSIGAGSTITNASTLKITGAPTGATNNRALWVAAGESRFDGTVSLQAGITNATSITFFGTNYGLGIDTSDLVMWSPVANGVSWKTVSVTGSTIMRMRGDGILVLGTTVAASGNAGELILANSKFIRMVNGAGTDTLGVLFLDGSNQLRLGSGAGVADILWGRALVALGTGATATLGAIGGSGPATAGQNAWMRIIDTTGVAFWVPAWK